MFASQGSRRTCRVAALVLLSFLARPDFIFAQEPPTPPPPSLPAPQIRTTEKIAIRAGRVFDGKSDEFKKQQIILMVGTKIVKVGSPSDGQIPPGPAVWALKNATVLPGL